MNDVVNQFIANDFVRQNVLNAGAFDAFDVLNALKVGLGREIDLRALVIQQFGWSWDADYFTAGHNIVWHKTDGFGNENELDINAVRTIRLHIAIKVF